MKLISDMINRETPLLEIQQKMIKKEKKDTYTSRELARDLNNGKKFLENESEIRDRFDERQIRLDQISAELEQIDRDSDFES